MLWLASLFVFIPTIDGCNARRNNQVPVGCGGVFLAIGPNMKGFVTTIGFFQSERAAWAHVDHPMLGNIGVWAVYSPCIGSRDRAQFWHEIVDTLDTSHNWIIGGDFNMVLAATDRRGGSRLIVVGRGKRAWNHLARKLCLTDTFQYKSGHLKYLWDTKRRFRHDPIVQLQPQIGDRVLKRIYWVHHSKFSRHCPYTITSTILPRYCMSDHALVVATIRSAAPHSRPSLYKVNSLHLKGEK